MLLTYFMPCPQVSVTVLLTWVSISLIPKVSCTSLIQVLYVFLVQRTSFACWSQFSAEVFSLVASINNWAHWSSYCQLCLVFHEGFRKRGSLASSGMLKAYCNTLSWWILYALSMFLGLVLVWLPLTLSPSLASWCSPRMQYNLMVKSIFGLGACSLGRNPSPGKLVALVHTLVPMGRILNESHVLDVI